MPEATEDFKRGLREAFDEMYVGQTFTFRRTFTDGDVALFCGVTGDYNPYHQDESFAKESWYGRLTIPGLLTGSMLTHIGGLLGFLATEMSFGYLAPVFVGDTITCTVTIAEKNEEKRRVLANAGFVNQDGVEVLRASFSGFPGRVRLAH
jgi:3-hydroxybutyryl-CoA dehydratase